MPGLSPDDAGDEDRWTTTARTTGDDWELCSLSVVVAVVVHRFTDPYRLARFRSAAPGKVLMATQRHVTTSTTNCYRDERDRINTARMATSAGFTPDILPAWPRVLGRTRVSFSRAS